MTIDADLPLTVLDRRRARRLTYWNGAVWAIGNGLASTTLVIYLAMELGVSRIGLGIGLIVAAPAIAGVLRLVGPVMIGRLTDRKRFCLVMYASSAIVLMLLPLAVSPGAMPSARLALAALVVLWCLYHLLEYMGTIALWSWQADLVPLRVRGRFIGIRGRWMTAGQAAAMICGGLFSYGWRETHPRDEQHWLGYAVPAALGTLFMLASVVPLAAVPGVVKSRVVRCGASLSAVFEPFTDRRFLRLVAFGCWFAFFNGLTQSVLHLYPARVLGISLFVVLALRTGLRCGQLTISPWVGRLADRLGNRPVMIVSLTAVATGPLFFLAATPEQPWWFVGAWIVWIAYAGLNVCLPNLMLKLSPDRSNTPYIAAYFATSGLFYAAGTIAGGAVFDAFGREVFVLLGGTLVMSYYQVAFLFGWALRTLGLVWLWAIIEPKGSAGKPGNSRRKLPCPACLP